MSLKAGIHLGNITLLAADKNEMRLDRDTRVSGHDQVEKVLMQQGGGSPAQSKQHEETFYLDVGIIPFYIALVQIYQIIYDRSNQRGY